MWNLVGSVVCLCWISVTVRGNPEGVRAGVDSASTNGVASLGGSNGQQSLQSVLYSIEERLRGLDLVYAPRYAPTRHWDAAETSARRLDAVDARLGRIEALLELRLDKVVEAVSSNQMKQSLFNDQISRKIDTLYDRLNHRMLYTENRLDLDVAKIQSSIDSGFVRIARTERESDSIEADLETQLNDLQKQFDSFETMQNASVAILTGLSNVKKGELNDDENVVKDFTKKDIEQFATSMENVATKVNKMVTDFSQRTATMEGLVKNSMSLSNATRRELQDGLRSLGLRLVYQGTKHNKEKESSFDFGWDALAALIAREFGNLSNQMAGNHDKMTAAQDAFRDSCYRLQEQDQQLAAHIANVLDKILDITDNRSQEVSKRIGTLSEVFKSHGVDGSKRLETRDKSLESLHQQLVALDTGLQVIKEQVNELSSLSAINEDVKESCPDATQIADRVALMIDSRQVSVEETSRLVAEKIISLINTSRISGKVFNDDEELPHLEEVTGEKDSSGKALKRTSVLDIAEEDLGETLEYNVTEDVETKAPLAESLRGKDLTGEANDFEFDKSQPDGDLDYDEDEDVLTDEIVETSENLSKKVDKETEVNGVMVESSGTVIDPSISSDILESITTQTSEISFPVEINHEVGKTEPNSGRKKTEFVEGEKTNYTKENIDSAHFSDYWHRLKNANATELSGIKAKVTPEGHETDGNVNKAAVGGKEMSQERATEEDLASNDNLQLKLYHQANVNHDEAEYDYAD